MQNETYKMQNATAHPPLCRPSGNGSAGFTLLEIIVVVFILSLLAAIVAPKIIGRTDDARIAEAKVQIRNMETALKLFKMDNGFFPDTQQGLRVSQREPAVPAGCQERIHCPS